MAVIRGRAISSFGQAFAGISGGYILLSPPPMIIKLSSEISDRLMDEESARLMDEISGILSNEESGKLIGEETGKLIAE